MFSLGRCIISKTPCLPATATTSSSGLESCLSRLSLDGVKPESQQKRSFIKYDFEDGNRQSDPHVIRRFTKLRWGAWIRGQPGYDKGHHKKGARRIYKLQKFSFCTRFESRTLDVMTTRYFRAKRFYPDDYLEPYHDRNWFFNPPAKKHQDPPKSLTRKQLEDKWYKLNNFVPEQDNYRPMKVHGDGNQLPNKVPPKRGYKAHWFGMA